MKTLDELCFEHGTDKGSMVGNNASEFVGRGGRPGHDYARHYELIFLPKRHKTISLLEIGVGDGASIKVWLEYFTKADVCGVDHGSNTCVWTVDSPIPERYTFVCGDQGKPDFWDAFLDDYGGGWDIIIDDGSHFNDDVILTFNKLWPAVAPGGCYCIEDLGTMNDLRPGPDHLTFVSGLVCELVGRRGSKSQSIDSIHLANELAILVKK